MANSQIEFLPGESHHSKNSKKFKNWIQENKETRKETSSERAVIALLSAIGTNICMRLKISYHCPFDQMKHLSEEVSKEFVSLKISGPQKKLPDNFHY